MDEERARSSSVAGRIRELEGTLEDVRRQLLEERRGKENFEDLLTALRGEIQQHRDERDNLRDVVVPQLRSQLERKEESSDHQKLANENLRMQQELQSLRNENTTLMNARRLQLDMQFHSPSFNSIAEEDDDPSPWSPAPMAGLTRSNSVARMNTKGGISRTSSLKRSNSISAKERESRDSLADRVKDIEMQRDALHQALRSLLDRQVYQHNEHTKKMRALEAERDRALHDHSPRRRGYEREVISLRNEIQSLRRRADEAFRQKWQCEKGLGGLKMDLDRAEQETSSLRMLLQEHDILIPELSRQPPQEIQPGAHATSASLEKAYQELRATQALSVSRIRDLRSQAPSSSEDEDLGLATEKHVRCRGGPRSGAETSPVRSSPRSRSPAGSGSMPYWRQRGLGGTASWVCQPCERSSIAGAHSARVKPRAPGTARGSSGTRGTRAEKVGLEDQQHARKAQSPRG